MTDFAMAGKDASLTLVDVGGAAGEGRASAFAELERRFGDRFSRGLTVREQHANTTTWYPNEAPEAVVFAQSSEEVAAVVRICAAHAVPLIPFGTGTSLEGQVNAPLGGISLDLRGMNRVLAVHSEDLDCTVEAGVTRTELNTHLRDTGLFFPIDPGADASLGGMAATRASGTNAVRYGTMKDNVLALTAVMADGTVVKTGRRAKKSSAGYDLTRLLIGSEGTLGVITELTLKLHGIPESIAGGICPFPSLEAACQAVIATIQSGVPVARIELLDEVQLRACNLYSKLGLRETPTLFVEFHGSPAGVSEQSETFGAIAEELGGGPFNWTKNAEERNRLWQARHDAYWAALQLRSGAKAIATDVCVPISRLSECILETKADIEQLGLLAPIVGHVGDGNFHLCLLCNMDDTDEVARAGELMERLVARALAMDGTSTGEHGIGQGKIKYLENELGDTVRVFETIKRALDPLNILNPGKIIRV